MHEQGCVQEEIRFLISPELIVSRLFVACLEPRDSLVILGAERFSKYCGYRDTFEFAGPYQDANPQYVVAVKISGGDGAWA